MADDPDLAVAEAGSWLDQATMLSESRPELSRPANSRPKRCNSDPHHVDAIRLLAETHFLNMTTQSRIRDSRTGHARRACLFATG